jgi:pimeloyl-ACP methyl ester carboxylesterase
VRVPSTDGVVLEVHDLGGRGEALLIAHATGMCALAYGPLAVPLRRRFHVWALDFRGHGDSSPPVDGDFAWSGMGEDVLAAVDAAAAGPVYGVGHSMGGAALLLAELRRPGLLRSAYLYEPIILPENAPPLGDDNPMAAGSRRRRPTFASRAEALWRYANRPPLDRWRADVLAAYVTHGFREQEDGSVRLKCEPEHEARTFEAESKMSVDLVRGLRMPTTVAIGAEAQGSPAPAAFGPSVAEAMPNARLESHRHLGHFGPLEAPNLVGDAVVEAFGLSPGVTRGPSTRRPG